MCKECKKKENEENGSSGRGEEETTNNTNKNNNNSKPKKVPAHNSAKTRSVGDSSREQKEEKSKIEQFLGGNNAHTIHRTHKYDEEKDPYGVARTSSKGVSSLFLDRISCINPSLRSLADIQQIGKGGGVYVPGVVINGTPFLAPCTISHKSDSTLDKDQIRSIAGKFFDRSNQAHVLGFRVQSDGSTQVSILFD